MMTFLLTYLVRYPTLLIGYQILNTYYFFYIYSYIILLRLVPPLESSCAPLGGRAPLVEYHWFSLSDT